MKPNSMVCAHRSAATALFIACLVNLPAAHGYFLFLHFAHQPARDARPQQRERDRNREANQPRETRRPDAAARDRVNGVDADPETAGVTLVGKPSEKSVEAMRARDRAIEKAKASTPGERADVHVHPIKRPSLDPGAEPEPRSEEIIEAERQQLADVERSIYRPLVPNRNFATIVRDDKAAEPGVMKRQRALLEGRYDLSDRPAIGVMMSGGRKAVQEGVRVKLPDGVTWEQLAEMSPAEIREKDLFPHGFMSLPHVKHEVGGQVFPPDQIEQIRLQEGRELDRFDVEFDLPEHMLPEFPPPIFLTTRPELGDVSQGQVLTIRNYYTIMYGKITPVQMEGLRLLLTPFPQEEFNQTEDRKVEEQSLGVTCLDCHVNFHTNAAFHLTPDIRPQSARFRLDTPSLRGMFNQQIHGSKRSLRSIEDFSEFEQRTAYFNGDHVAATKKGLHLPDRPNQVAMMAQMQNIIDFPPAPKLTPLGRLDPGMATESELRGEALFHGKAGCNICHPPPFFLDDKMHDLRLERFFETRMVNGHLINGDGPIKSFTLRGIKDTPPYLHDGRLMTLEDTVEFFNLVLGLKLSGQEKADLVAFMRAL